MLATIVAIAHYNKQAQKLSIRAIGVCTLSLILAAEKLIPAAEIMRYFLCLQNTLFTSICGTCVVYFYFVK